MTSLKCPNCSLVNFATVEICKRCGNHLTVSKPTSPQNVRQKQISTSCPDCASSDTQSFQMAYQTGTSSGNLSVATYNPHTGFGVGGGKTSNQTILANQVRPPVAPSNSGCANVLAFCLLFLMVFSISWTLPVIIVGKIASVSAPNASGMITGAAAILFIVPAVVVAIYAYSYLQKGSAENEKRYLADYQNEIARWSKSWICLRCGCVWLIENR